MWPLKGKPKRVIVRRYRAMTEGGARRRFERDANELAKKGYRPRDAADKSHLFAVQHGDIFVTYELVELPRPPAPTPARPAAPTPAPAVVPPARPPVRPIGGEVAHGSGDSPSPSSTAGPAPVGSPVRSSGPVAGPQGFIRAWLRWGWIGKIVSILAVLWLLDLARVEVLGSGTPTPPPSASVAVVAPATPPPTAAATSPRSGGPTTGSAIAQLTSAIEAHEGDFEPYNANWDNLRVSIRSGELDVSVQPDALVNSADVLRHGGVDALAVSAAVFATFPSVKTIRMEVDAVFTDSAGNNPTVEPAGWLIISRQTAATFDYAALGSGPPTDIWCLSDNYSVLGTVWSDISTSDRGCLTGPVGP